MERNTYISNYSNTTILVKTIPSSNDPIYTVGVAYKMIFTVSQSGILTAYTLFNHTIPIFAYNRYPFAQDINISTVLSFISFNDYYMPKFLIYPVLYDGKGFYLRLASLEQTALNFLVTDLPLFSMTTLSISFSEISAVFVNNTSFVFIYNMSIVKYFYINNYKLQVPIMTKIEYQEMKKKWKTTNFLFRVVGFNENNNSSTPYYNLTIMDYDEEFHENPSLPIWLIPAISCGVLLILIITVKLIYRFIFKHRTRIVEIDFDRSMDSSY